MTAREINIAIAELCGWTQIERTGLLIAGGAYIGYPPNNPIIGKKQAIPAYYSDLNACHEMEESLDENPFFKFTCELARIRYRDAPENNSFKRRCNSHAKARQRCEAFLRIHGKWKE